MEKKNNVAIVIVIIIVLVIVAMLTLKNRNKELRESPPLPFTQTEIDINKAISSDKTTDITKSLDSINLDDTSTTDLQEVDSELQKL